MAVGSYSQDVLTRIFNVHWGGGGVFVAANNDGNIYYLNPADVKPGGQPAWESLGTLDFVNDADMFTGYPTGSAYASVSVKDAFDHVIGKTPVFVLVGGGGSTHGIGIIMASRDGKAWSRVFSYGTNSDTYTGATIFGVAWDEQEQAFYAGGHESNNFADHATETRWQTETDILFRSSDGFSWVEVGRNEMRVDSSGGAPFPPWPEYKTGLLVAHCRDLVKDVNNNKIPDGNYGYNDTEKLLVAPTEPAAIAYLTGFMGASPGAKISTKIVGGGVPPTYPSDTGFPATCVATAGDTWVAAGGVYDPAGGGQPPSGGGRSQAAILVSSEGGYTWKSLNPPGTNIIITMCGGDARL